MKRRRISASRSKLETDSGEVAERMANTAYDYNGSKTGSYYDGARDTGAKVQVKSTFKQIGQQTQTLGRYRIPESQHSKLVKRDRSGSCKYVFVLFDGSTSKQIPKDAYMKQIAPARLGRLIGAMGGFESSGHSGFDREKKLPWTAIFEPSKVGGRID